MTASLSRILIVDDNPADVLFVKRALRDDGLIAEIDVAGDGEQAIQYLENCTDDRAPRLVIIDINLPKRDGIEVLSKCRFRPALAETRTMMLTSSDAPVDHNRAEMLGADQYVRKPGNLDQLHAVVRTIRFLLA